MIPESQLTKWRRLADEATSGDWSAGAPPSCVVAGSRGIVAAIPPPSRGGVFECEANRDLIITARSAIPALVEEVRTLQGLLRTVVATTHRPDAADQSRVSVPPGQQLRFDRLIDIICDAVSSAP